MVRPGESLTHFLVVRAVPVCFILAAKLSAPLYIVPYFLRILAGERRPSLNNVVENFGRSTTFLGNNGTLIILPLIMESESISYPPPPIYT